MPRRPVCAPTAAAFILTQTAPERRWIMKARSTKLTLEALEDRSVPSAVSYADFNNDGHMDRAAVTSPTTITVSLANPDGSYTVSATLTTPTKLPISDVGVGDLDHDGKQDIYAFTPYSSGFYYLHSWLGNGDGTFGSRTTEKIHTPGNRFGF
jgi:hypothetical protein